LANARVATVVRPLDRVLVVLRVAPVPILALSLSLPTIESLVSSSKAAPHEWLLGIIGTALAATYIVLLNTQVVGSRIDSVIGGVRRWVALACNHDGAKHDAGVACWLTPEVFQAPLFPYQQQQRALVELAHACESEDTGQYWFVEGDSGSGKTRTALMLVQRLVRDKRLSALANRCYLYDFAESDAVQDELRGSIAKTRRDSAVVMVDNFQLVRPEILKALTHHLVDGEDATARLLLFLTRPGDSWNRSPGSDIRLVSEAKAARRYLPLAGPSPESITRHLFDLDPDAAELIRKLAKPGAASAAQLHIAQVVARNRKTPPEVLTILRRLVGEQDTAADRGLMSALAIATGLAMHRGGFSRRELWRAIWSTGPSESLKARLASASQSYATVRRLHGFGLISRIDVGGSRYVFHEALAELCIDRLSSSTPFAEAFAAVGRERLERLRSDNSALDAWLIAAEIGTQGTLESTFDGALSTGAYRPMVTCLRRAGIRYELSDVARLQLAILLNRTGSLAESRATFTDELVRALSSSSQLATMLVTSRIEATHDEAAEAALETLCNHEDRVVALTGEYWKIHMRAHHGQFDSQGLRDMASELHARLDRGENYWLTYSLARMHFDALRHLYLEGRISAHEIAWNDIDAYLYSRLPTFEGLHRLYTRAHFVGHFLLPQLALFDEPVGSDDARTIGLEPEHATVAGLIGAAQRLYRRAAEEFEQYGDREAQYLKADILNAKLIADAADPEEVQRLLNEYSALGAANFRSIASYPHFYQFRWQILQYYRRLLDSRTVDPTTADQHLGPAEWHLQRVAALDRRTGNEYGILRARLLSALFESVKNKTPVDRGELRTLAQRATERGYTFEQRLLRRLIDEEGSRHADLHAIFRFYPFVHQ
jgi:hypothetical protein